MAIERNRGEIDEQSFLAHESIDEGRSKWPSMTYEQGVDAALRWVTGETDDVPMEDE